MIVMAVLTLVPSTFAQTFSTQENIKQETYDLSLLWSKTVGSKEWTKCTLWDEALTHCYISFKFNAGASLSIPASLKVTYPEIVERGQQFNINTELTIPSNKEVVISTEFYIKIDLDLPGLTTYIPGIGFTDNIDNIYGGSYDFTFALNSNTVQRVLKTISLGTDDNSLQSFLPSLSINDYITIEDLQMNSQTLGQIILGSFKVSFLQLILDAAKTLTSVAPPISAVISALDWLVTNVIKVDTGLLIQPVISAEINSPISSDNKLSLNRYTLNYDQDISSKSTLCIVQDSASEGRYNNKLYVNYGPVNYRLSFDNNWRYYLDLDLNFLGLSLYQNSWTWNLGTYPSIFTDIPSSSHQISLNIRIDEPLHATSPSVNDGDISITATDASGISNLVLVYSTDGVNWERTNMNSQGDNFSAKPINSVQTATIVYYYFEAIDGDNDRYTIDNNGQKFSYTMTPVSMGFSLFTNSSDIWLIALVAAIVIVLILGLIFIKVLKKRSQNSKLPPHF
jgi:hypothetical protein